MSTFSLHKKYDDSIFYVNLTSRNYPSSENFNTIQYTSNLGIISLESLHQNISKKYVGDFATIGAPYPIAVRTVKDNVFIVERPPFQVKVDYSPTRSGVKRRPIKPVSIWIPWTVSVYDLSSTVHNFLSNFQIHFNNAPLSSLEDLVIPAYTSNVYTGGNICLGQTYNSISQKIASGVISNFSELHSHMFNEYFTGGWNSDLSGNLHLSLNSVNSPYLIPDFSSLDSSHPIAKRAIDLKLKMFSSHHYTYNYGNLYYNLSLLSLEETLDLVKSLKQPHSHMSKSTVSSLLSRARNSSNLDRLNVTDNFSRNYRNVNVIIKNTSFDSETGASQFYYNRAVPESILNFFKENSEKIIDDIHSYYVQNPNNMTISLQYEIAVELEKEVEDVF